MSWHAAGSPSIIVLSLRHSVQTNHTLDRTDFFTELRSTALLTCWHVNPDVSYAQLKQLLADGKTVVVDVREPWELREYGFIPGSVNVPLGQVNTALQLAPEEFKDKYDGEMPRQTDNIVFVCLAGVRSKTALNTAASLGFTDVQHYPGGWQDWAEQEQLK
uniref:Rhodanese domain-containing protein n=1 Tax=Xiphophorus couchianus TaxID=32473 RepID=A0A3B5MNI6_9TELE